MDDMLKEFVVEAIDLASQVEDNLLVLEKNPADLDTINVIFRSFHTIKGGAGFMGLSSMVSACHLTENLFDALRTGKASVTSDTIEAALQASSFVAQQLDELSSGTSPDDLPPLPGDIKDMLTQAIAGGGGDASAPTEPSPPPAPAPIPVNAADTHPEPDWHTLYNALVPADKQIEAPTPPPATAGAFDPESTAEVSGAASASPDTDHDKKTATPLEVHHAKPGEWDGQDRRKPGSSAKDDSIRIDAAKLDVLLEVAGEAAQAANQASVLLDKLRLFPFEDEAMELIDNLIETQARASRYSTELQRATLSTRMQPVGRLFQRFPRLIRELSKELGKDVNLVIEGAETEVDRLVVDSLYDPLVHMLRNSLDHGVEPPEDREKTGKPKQAKILLKAWQEASSVMIIVSDDGRGMDPAKLRAKAMEKGLIGPNTATTDDEAYQLVFLPGFSTKEVASSISGRGVGMDVVRNAVEQHRGTIWIDSKLGVGTTFSIRLPIALSIIPMLLVSTSGAKLGLPMSLVERVVELPAAFEEVGGRAVFRDQGRPLPVLSMANVLGYEPCTEQAGIVIASPDPYILSVEMLDGTADLVIKPLTGINVTGIAGTTRSAEGELVLVVSLSFLLDGIRGTSASARHLSS
ncbi:MAG: chemotaxis protein CheA [Burkholderiaceae bacterium]|jgi:two-component system chemotaxis sensor kinase CheA|nr:chemotaxis protein CheA [Burkholderiaceae bacterium]